MQNILSNYQIILIKSSYNRIFFGVRKEMKQNNKFIRLVNLCIYNSQNLGKSTYDLDKLTLC